LIILGLNAFHGDSSAALIRDGKLVAAAEEERFRRIKHWAGFPSKSVEWCLAHAGLTLSDVDHVAINQNGFANFGRKLAYVIFNHNDPALLMQRFRNRRARKTSGNSWKKLFHHNSCELRYIILNIIWHIYRRRSMSRPSRKLLSFPLMVLGILRVRPYAIANGARWVFTGQWGVSFDVYYFGPSAEAFIGKWAHNWHPPGEMAQYQAAVGQPFEEKQTSCGSRRQGPRW
jgi:hypothetical protein